MLSADRLLHYFQPLAKTHVISHNREEAFRLARQSSNNLVIWEREVDAAISDFIDLLQLSTFKPINMLVEKGQVEPKLKDHFADYISLHSGGANSLMVDISLLTESFLELCGKQQLRLHLRSVEDDACRKFHVDGYPMRLICTYSGPGTEWLPNNSVNRKALGTTNERIVKNPDRIRQMKTFDVGIMKGHHLNHHSKNGIVHRSPAVKESGLRRFVLRLDV